MSDDLAARITALIEAHRTGSDCEDWQQAMATRFGALGVYGDVGGALLVRSDGSVLSVGWDDEQPAEASDGWRAVALAAASHTFPELAALAPERPATATPCWKCDGSGCGWCLGMGWLLDNLE